MQKNFKYILIFALVFLVFTFSACSVGNDVPSANIPQKFESNFDANFNELELSGRISKLETGIYTITLSSPKSLDGLEFNCVGDKICTNLDGLEIETSCDSLPSLSFIKSVTNALDTASKSSSVSVTKADGYNQFSAPTQSGTFCILQEQDSESIVSLTIESADISVNFSDFSAK